MIGIREDKKEEETKEIKKDPIEQSKEDMAKAEKKQPDPSEQKPSEEAKPEEKPAEPEKKESEKPEQKPEEKPEEKPEQKEQPKPMERKPLDAGTIFVGSKKTTNEYVMAALTQLYNRDDLKIKARGRAIGIAVNVSEVLKHRHGLEEKGVKLGTEEVDDEVRGKLNVSTIEITVKKAG